ncbi:MAG: isopenicillin-N epimerase [Planctomycetota bacterium]|jgi:isopenicillin-N epimerase
MLDRRQVLSLAPAALIARGGNHGAASSRAEVAELATHAGTPEAIADDEDYWTVIQRAFPIERSLIDLNNGNCSPCPNVVLDAWVQGMREAEGSPSYTMRRVLEPRRHVAHAGLADIFGVSEDEIALVPNASFGLEALQLGFDLKPGAELLTTDQDYPHMRAAFRQREAREGMVCRTIEAPKPLNDPAELVRRFEAAITERTGLILCCHMVNLNGQILPVADIVALGARHGIPVIVDGAHGFAHDPAMQKDLGCEFYSTSLHKWLQAPIGTGMLYIKKERIEEVWPLMTADERLTKQMSKFEQRGTRDVAAELAVAEAVDFHRAVGADRKAARMVWMRERWSKRFQGDERFIMRTDLTPGRAFGIATFTIEGIEDGALQRHMWRKHRIHTTVVGEEEGRGVRVSPGIQTTRASLDIFGDAIEKVLCHGLPA